MKKISKPTEVEVKELSKFFPSYKQNPGPSFDPNATCVVSAQQRKKKVGIKRKPKDSKITAMLMKKFVPTVPRGKARQKLASEGRMQSIRLTRDLNAKQVREILTTAFLCSDDFTFLECDSASRTLCKCSNQNIDAEMAIERKGTLYLCETFKVSRI